MVETHNLHLLESELSDIYSAAYPEYDQMRARAFNAESIVQRLAEWSRRWPKEPIYSATKQKECEGEIEEIEGAAKRMFPSQNVTGEAGAALPPPSCSPD